jgi:ferredoxin-NADP reductase
MFLTAGSGVTPVMAMLRSLTRRGEFSDVLHIHSARTQSEAIFVADLAAGRPLMVDMPTPAQAVNARLLN